MDYGFPEQGLGWSQGLFAGKIATLPLASTHVKGQDEDGAGQEEAVKSKGPELH